MRFAVLGPLEVRSPAGDLLPLPRRKARELLAVLILRANRLVAADEIIDYLWDQRPPASARANLQSYVTELRRMLGDQADRLERTDGRYRLRADTSELDAALFEQLARQGHEALGDHDPALALTKLTQAGALWRGRSVAEGLTLPRALEPDVARLTETRLVAFEDGIDARLELGQHTHLEPELLPMLAEHPYRERLAGQLMLVRYRCGRQADALAAFRAVRDRLDGELGIRPGDHLEGLHRRILDTDPALAPPTGETDVPEGAPPAIPRQLPAEPPVFVGRSAELRRVLELASTPGAVVVDGMGGVGKTALAVSAAHRLAPDYPDGQLFVDLRGFAPGRSPVDTADALFEMLWALGCAGRQIPDSLSGRVSMWRSLVAGRRLLLVLDNVASEAQVEPLIPASPNCCVLVTSRRRLSGLEHQQPVSLDVIDGAQGAELLTETVGAERLEQAPSGVAAQISDLCGGLPLAIRVAASRMRARPAWTGETLLTRLRGAQSRLTELESGERSVPAAFQLSYGQLDDEQRRVFRLLSLNPGGDLTSAAAAALTGSDVAAVERCLERLVDDHLVREDTAGRYRLHDLLEEYAAGLAAGTETPDERHEAVRRLVDWYLHASFLAGTRIDPWRPRSSPDSPAPAGLPDVADYESALAWLESEWRNLVAVVSHAADNGLYAYAWKIAHSMFDFFLARGYNAQFVTTNRTALAAARAEGDLWAEAQISTNLGVALGRSARYPEALDALNTALELFRQLDDESRVASILSNLGGVLWHSGRRAEAIDSVSRGLATARPLGDDMLLSTLLNNVGELYRRTGRYGSAREHLEEALSIVERSGSLRRTSTVLTGLGATLAELDEPESAREHLDRALDLARRAGHREGEGRVRYERGMLDARGGHAYSAMEHHRAATAIAREIGDATLEAEALNGIGEVSRQLGEHEGALEHHRTALAAADRAGDPAERARAEAGAGRAMVSIGDTARASEHIARAVRVYESLGAPAPEDLRSLLERLDT